MTNKAVAKDFNDKAKSYLYTVNVKPKNASKKTDFTDAAQKMATKVQTAAKDSGLEKSVKVQFAKGALAKAGIFFMNAPEKFAATVKKMDGIETVTKPSDKKKGKRAKKSR